MAVRKTSFILKIENYCDRKKQLLYSCYINTNTKPVAKTKREICLGKERFVDSSSVLVRHTLQQGYVVSFQHDPP